MSPSYKANSSVEFVISYSIGETSFVNIQTQPLVSNPMDLFLEQEKVRLESKKKGWTTITLLY